MQTVEPQPPQKPPPAPEKNSTAPLTVALSLYTAHKPKRLSKAFWLDENGLTKESGGNMVSGEVEMLTLTFAEFGALLPTLTPQQALGYGVNGHTRASVVTAERLKKIKTQGKVPCIARTTDHLHWPDGPGILLLDYDPPSKQQPLHRDDLLASLYEVCPALKNAPHLWRPSASSCIYRTDTGKELRGVCGQRVYVLVRSAGDIERTGQTLFDRLWLAGKGWYEVGKAGQLLKRSLIDGAVFQANRLDFCGGAECGPDLEQRLPEPILYNPDAPPLDTSTVLPDLDFKEEAILKKLREEQANALRGEVAEKREAWVEERVEEELQAQQTQKKLPEAEANKKKRELTDAYRRACWDDGRLLSAFVLHVKDIGPVSVGDILKDPEQYHGRYCKDPLEPDYNEGADCAWLNLRVPGHPKLFSHAHGGRWYSLHRQVKTLKVEGGQLHNMVDTCLEIIRQDGRVFERQGVLVRVVDHSNSIPEVTPEYMAVYLNRLANFEKFNANAGMYKPVDCPARLAKSVCAMCGEWLLRELRAIINAPLMSLSGRILEEDGYDSETKLLLRFEGADRWKTIPQNPTRAEVRDAFGALWHPFKDFPFVGPTDKGVFVQSELTAVQRPVLPTAPATDFDAPAAGSGKTLLAKSIAALAGETAPELLPPIKGGNDDEVRKRLFTSAYRGDRVLVFDNVVGQMESPALCAYLTAEQFSDRILGQSKMGSAPVTALMIITGNNIQPVGDLNRRVLRCRIDPEMERPFTRRFDLNPFAYVKKNRLEMVRAALILLQAHRASGHTTADSVASYEDWNEQVRATVLWLAEEFPEFDLGDPLDSITATLNHDPETNKLRALLEAWHESFEDVPTLVGSAIKAAEQQRRDAEAPGGEDCDTALFDAMDEIAGEKRSINSRRLGRWIEKFQGKIVNGKRFVPGEKSRGSRTWIVEQVLKRGEI